MRCTFCFEPYVINSASLEFVFFAITQLTRTTLSAVGTSIKFNNNVMKNVANVDYITYENIWNNNNLQIHRKLYDKCCSLLCTYTLEESLV